MQKVADCDAVNIQMELGLYGSNPNKSVRFIKKIIKAARKSSITMHRLDPPRPDFLRSSYNNSKSLKLNAIFKELILYQVRRLYVDLVKFGVRYNASFIVHTYRDEQRVLDIDPTANVIVHPIIWPENYGLDGEVKDISGYRNFYSDQTLPIIGLFGFMTDYKNFLQVVRVVNQTREHNILLAGGTHPFSHEYGIRQDKKISQDSHGLISERQAISEIALNQTDGRMFLHLIHTPEDDDLIKLIRDVDIVCVPYSEVGQSASGIASLAVQFGKQLVFSDTFTSRELDRFLKSPLTKFDTNSDFSLVSTLRIVSSSGGCSTRFDGYSFSTNIAAYLNSLDIRV